MRSKILFLLILSFNIHSVFAATDGTLGATSQGTVNISLTIPQLVRISGLSDIALGTVTSAPATGNTTACIYSNSAGNYSITATGSGTAGAFTVTDGTNNISYSSTWDDGVAGATALTAGTALTGRQGASTTSVTCGGGSNSTFAITFSEADIAAAPQGNYTGVATLLISPP